MNSPDVAQTSAEQLTQIAGKLREAIDSAMEELNEFVMRAEVQSLLREMYSLPPETRYEFVELAWLDHNVLKARGIEPPKGVVIQRSVFADNRPTLFCVSKTLPPGLGWHKVTITFDNEEAGRHDIT